MRVFGLTGGIGSGKSLVAAHWRGLGLPVVDADELARLAVAPGSPTLASIVERYGSQLLTEDGSLARATLARIVFDDPEARTHLEALVHPVVRELAQARFAALEASGLPLACYEVPLLFEVGLHDELRPVVVVSAPEAQRYDRLRRRDGADDDAIRRRIASQWPLERKRALADYSIDNAGTPDQARRAADGVLRQVARGLGAAPPPYGSSVMAGFNPLGH